MLALLLAACRFPSTGRTSERTITASVTARPIARSPEKINLYPRFSLIATCSFLVSNLDMLVTPPRLPTFRHYRVYL